MDKIIIKGLEIFAYHGVNDEEKEQGQNFVLDITLWADLLQACESDNLEDTVNYAAVRKTVTRVMTENRYDLIEAAAENTAQAILDEFPKISKVEITLKKPQAPMNAEFDYVAVDIMRQRS